MRVQSNTTTPEERELIARFGPGVVDRVVHEVGLSAMRSAWKELAKMRIPPAGGVVFGHTKTKVYPVDLNGSYALVLDAAEGKAPPLDFNKFRELDAWLLNECRFELMYLSFGAAGGDFASLDEETQRWFLLLCAEVLYGENRDEAILEDAVIWAREDGE